jgi:hypothetical protein
MCYAAELPKFKIMVPKSVSTKGDQSTDQGDQSTEIGDKPTEKKIMYESVDMGKYHRNNQSAREFGFFVSEALREQQSKAICKSRVFASCIDEATDKAKKQSLAQCVSFMENGKVQHQFSNMIELHSQDAETIYNADREALILLFDCDETRMDKAHVGFASDGASVVCGHKTGVAARYKEASPRILSFHCAAHKQSLCATNAWATTLIFIIIVFFFLDKKNSSSNSGAKMHQFTLCSQRSVSYSFF